MIFGLKGRMCSLLLASLILISVFSFGVFAQSGSGNDDSDDDSYSLRQGISEEDLDDNSERDRFRERTEVRVFDAEGIERRIEIQNRQRVGESGVISSGSVEAESELELEGGFGGGFEGVRARFSNGVNAEIKIMPDVAAERALDALRLRVCNEDNGCSIVLKESEREKNRAVYEVRAEKQVRVFGLFRARMNVESEIDAESGEVVEVERPWWGVFASESTSETEN